MKLYANVCSILNACIHIHYFKRVSSKNITFKRTMENATALKKALCNLCTSLILVSDIIAQKPEQQKAFILKRTAIPCPSFDLQ